MGDKYLKYIDYIINDMIKNTTYDCYGGGGITINFPMYHYEFGYGFLSNDIINGGYGVKGWLVGSDDISYIEGMYGARKEESEEIFTNYWRTLCNKIIDEGCINLENE